MKPYIDQIDGEFILREFSDDVDPIDLKWHRDLKNREIISVEETDWMIQMENSLPEIITKKIIPSLEWHSLIKVNKKLILKIKEF